MNESLMIRREIQHDINRECRRKQLLEFYKHGTPGKYMAYYDTLSSRTYEREIIGIYEDLKDAVTAATPANNKVMRDERETIL